MKEFAVHLIDFREFCPVVLCQCSKKFGIDIKNSFVVKETRDYDYYTVTFICPECRQKQESIITARAGRGKDFFNPRGRLPINLISEDGHILSLGGINSFGMEISPGIFNIHILSEHEYFKERFFRLKKNRTIESRP